MTKLLIATLALSAACAADRLEFATAKREIVEARLEQISRNVAGRRATLAAEFESAGCKAPLLVEQAVKRTKDPNVICTLDGAGNSDIVIGAHYDLATLGTGAVDNWSGASLLPSLYQAMALKPRRHRFVFVAFSGEEKGLLGSYGYVQSLSKDERAAVRAYVNHDGLGLGPAAIWLSRADKMLANSFANLADIMKIPVLAVNADRVAQDDAFPFGDARIPTLSVHSITPQNMRILHSVNDKLDAINREDYWRTYILLCAWLTWLDSAPERNPA